MAEFSCCKIVMKNGERRAQFIGSLEGLTHPRGWDFGAYISSARTSLVLTDSFWSALLNAFCPLPNHGGQQARYIPQLRIPPKNRHFVRGCLKTVRERPKLSEIFDKTDK